MRGILLSLFGAFVGAALWVGISKIPLPVFLAGLAAALAGGTTGWGMRLGTPGAAPGLRFVAVVFSALSVVLGRYATFLLNLREGISWRDPDVLERFLKILGSGWISPLLFAVAAWFAWSSSRK